MLFKSIGIKNYASDLDIFPVNMSWMMTEYPAFCHDPSEHVTISRGIAGEKGRFEFGKEIAFSFIGQRYGRTGNHSAAAL